MRRLLTLSLVTLVACSSSGSDQPADDGGNPDGTGQDTGIDGASETGPGDGAVDSAPVVTHPTNIIGNGGFEFGLMCYGNWVWSKTGKDYVGDYRFHLSSDAHEGTHSLEIRCEGTDCGWPAKAAIVSNDIPSPHSQAYKLTVWTKCDAGKNAFFYTPNEAKGEFSKPLACTGAWATNQIDFTSSAKDDVIHYALYYADTGSLFVDDVVMTYADGSVPAHTVAHPGTRSVSIAGNRVTVDGAPYLALGFYNVPYAALSEAQKMGTNTVTALGGELTADCFNTERGTYGDRAYELGIGTLPDSTTTARLAVADIYPAIMARFAPHLANVAWHLIDEPDQVAVPWYPLSAVDLIAAHDAMRTKTTLPITADFQHAAYDPASVDKPYENGVELYMAEPYGDDFSSITHATVTVFGAMKPRPIWLAQDAVSTDRIVPKAYAVMISGSTGLLYFTWGDFAGDATKMAMAKQAFGELSGLKSAIFGDDATSAVTGPAGIRFIARKSGGKTYVIAVNPTTTPVSGDFSMSGLAAGTKIDVQFESRTITSAAGKFSDSFAGVSRHVYTF
jgi:hypothetical protein